MSLFDASFFKRLGFYLFGLSIGIVFLAFFFKKKTEETGVSFCYLPNCRTLKDMRSKPITYSDEIGTMLQNKELDTTALHIFFTAGDVDFSKSDTEAAPCKKYRINHETDEGLTRINVANCANKVVIMDFEVVAEF
ncbi:MAG: DUF4258 domain-containing protein [Maribacter sp.]